MPKRIVPSSTDQRTLIQMLRWIRNFKITGTGVTFSNTPESCVVNITPPTPRNWIQPPTGYWFTLVSTVGGSAYGKYNVHLMNPPTSDVSVTAAAAAGDFGTVPGSPVSAIAINNQETDSGRSTWDLQTSGGFVPQFFWGWVIRINSTGTMILGFDGKQWENCT
jgi:hypothetical protein